MRAAVRCGVVVAVVALIGGCATESAPPSVSAPVKERAVTTTDANTILDNSPIPPQLEPEQAVGVKDAAPVIREVFPHVRVDGAKRTVELDGFIPIDADDDLDPYVFLETVACVLGTKDHETLVSTPALASHVHAALLLLGLEPGEPGRVEWRDDEPVAIAPTGAALRVSIRWGDGDTRTSVDARQLIRNARTGEMLSDDTGWVFAGSYFDDRGEGPSYAADMAGTIVGLATFGTETIGLTNAFSHEAGVHPPEWVATPGALPAFETPVVVVIEAIE